MKFAHIQPIVNEPALYASSLKPNALRREALSVSVGACPVKSEIFNWGASVAI